MKPDGLTRLMRLKFKKPTGNSRLAGESLKSAQTVIDSNKNDSEEVFPSGANSVEKLKMLIREVIHSIPIGNSDSAACQFSQEYYKLDYKNRCLALDLLANEYGVDRHNSRRIAQHYLNLQNENDRPQADLEENLSAIYRTEQKLRLALTPISVQLFKQIHSQPGGLKFLVDLRGDLKAITDENNAASLRSLDAGLKEMLEIALNPAGLTLHQFTWNDPASLLEKIVAYEAVHPINNLYDLKRRLGYGRRCFGYFHPSMPGEPLNFIEVALTKSMLESIQDLLWNEQPFPENEASTAMFYSISSTQPGLAGINLGKFLIKRVVRLLQQQLPGIQNFATLSPIPGFMSWLLPRLASQAHFSLCSSSHSENASIFKENILHPWEEKLLLTVYKGDAQYGNNAVVLLWNILTSPNQEWAGSESLRNAMKPILLRLCARYLLKEKKRGKALDPVANFHIQNGASMERLNWMGDHSEQGIIQSGGIMVNYIYRLDRIEENSRLYLEKGVISTSPALNELLESKVHE